jgi:hypothetical protein
MKNNFQSEFDGEPVRGTGETGQRLYSGRGTGNFFYSLELGAITS